LFWIVEIASKGGNYLLNVGPDGNGVIPEASIKVLKEIGSWMKVNGEAVYGTTRWSTLKEGPTVLEMKSTTARKDQGFNTVFTSEDFWFTQKDNNVYAISLACTSDDTVRLEALYDHRDKIRSISMLGERGKLKWSAADGRVNVKIPAGKNPDIPGFVLKVSM